MKIIVMILTLNAMTALAAEKLPEAPVIDAGNFRVFITMDRYTFDEGNPVLLKFHINNAADKEVGFRVYQMIYTTFRPVVFDMSGREAVTRIPYRLKNENIEDYLKLNPPREIVIAPGESFTYTVNLAAIYTLEPGIRYRVKGFFFPDALGKISVAGDTALDIRIRKPAKALEDSGIAKLSEEITPAEVVYLFLNAEKRKDWKNHIKYLNIAHYINAYPDFAKRYNRADQAQKQRIERDFITYLSSGRDDYLLDFRVQKEVTLAGRNIARVSATVKRFDPRWTTVYRNRFTLEKYRDRWVIIDCVATTIKDN